MIFKTDSHRYTLKDCNFKKCHKYINESSGYVKIFVRDSVPSYTCCMLALPCRLRVTCWFQVILCGRNIFNWIQIITKVQINLNQCAISLYAPICCSMDFQTKKNVVTCKFYMVTSVSQVCCLTIFCLIYEQEEGPQERSKVKLHAGDWCIWHAFEGTDNSLSNL